MNSQTFLCQQDKFKYMSDRFSFTLQAVVSRGFSLAWHGVASHVKFTDLASLTIFTNRIFITFYPTLPSSPFAIQPRWLVTVVVMVVVAVGFVALSVLLCHANAPRIRLEDAGCKNISVIECESYFHISGKGKRTNIIEIR